MNSNENKWFKKYLIKNVLKDGLGGEFKLFLIFSDVTSGPVPTSSYDSTIATSVKGSSVSIRQSFDVTSSLKYAIRASKVSGVPDGLTTPNDNPKVGGISYWTNSDADTAPYDSIYVRIPDIRLTSGSSTTFRIVSLVLTTEASVSTITDSNSTIVSQAIYPSQVSLSLNNVGSIRPYTVVVEL